METDRQTDSQPDRQTDRKTAGRTNRRAGGQVLAYMSISGCGCRVSELSTYGFRSCLGVRGLGLRLWVVGLGSWVSG